MPHDKDGAVLPVTIQNLDKLAATRGGRVALTGFEYQRAFAVLRLTAMALATPLQGSPAHPIWMRYEWAEDLDELQSNGDFVLWQCKHGGSWTHADSIAEVLAGFAPKWLWTATIDRSRLRFRLVTNDSSYAQYHAAPGPLKSKKSDTFKAFKKLLNSAGGRSDIALWKQDAPTAKELFRFFQKLWSHTQVLYVPGKATKDAQGLVWFAEQFASNALCSHELVGHSRDRMEAVQRLHGLLNIVTSYDGLDELIDRPPTSPMEIAPQQVVSRLSPLRPLVARAPLKVLDHRDLEVLATSSDRAPFVARRPEWKDVVRGYDTDIKFFERTAALPLFDELKTALASAGQHSRLQTKWIIGAPGSGKSTLALRVAARLTMAQHCVVVDARDGLEEESEMPPMLEALQELAAEQPVLLLLDDPLGATSGWPKLLRKLGKTNPAIVVLSATPDFLWDHHRHELSDMSILPEHCLAKPDAAERQALHDLYPKSPSALTQQDEELLVMAMAVAADQSFNEIIRGIWKTLGDGNEPARTAPSQSLSWAQAAYTLVTYFHRANAHCPQFLVQALLQSRAAAFDEGSIEQLAQMRDRSGWSIFNINEPEQRWAYQGSTITTMHAKVAQQAWSLRPASGWDVRAQIARLSPSKPQIARLLAKAIGTMADTSEGSVEAKQLLAEIENVWSDPAVDAQIQTLQLVELISTLPQSLPPSLKVMKRLYARAHAFNEQSWLAGLQLMLCHNRGQVDQALLPDASSWPRVIETADFMLAPNRATHLATRLSDDAVLRELILQRLWQAFDGRHSAHDFKSHFIDFLLSNGQQTDTVPRLDEIRRYLRVVDDSKGAKLAWLTYLTRHPQHCQEVDIQQAIQDLEVLPDAQALWQPVIRMLAERDDQRLCKTLSNGLEQLKPGPTSFITASSAILALHQVVDDAEVFGGWMQWLINTLELYQGSARVQIIENAHRSLVSNIAGMPNVSSQVREQLDASIAAVAAWKASLPL